MMAAKKRSLVQKDTAEKRRRVAEPTAASERPRRAAKARQEVASGPKSQKANIGKQRTKAVPDIVASQPPQTDAETEPIHRAPANKNASKKVEESAEHSDGQRNYWLMKAEPETRLEKGVDVKFSIADLAARAEPEAWDGVRNPMAQKNMRSMKEGDLAFFYHSNCKVPGIAGIMKIVREHSTDESAFDPSHPYYDPKSNRDKPRWCVVHVEHVATFENFISLKTLQEHKAAGGALASMQVLKMSRLSVSSVTEEEWIFILRELAGADGRAFLGQSKA